MRDRSDGWIYIIDESADGPVKIGFANNVDERIKQLQTGNPRQLTIVAQMFGSAGSEAALHRICAEYRVFGEWFRREGAVLDLIALVKRCEPHDMRVAHQRWRERHGH